VNQFQEKLLDMMAWFHQFCIDNELRYYALGGTMLGAMRHEGFIPWDDDLDVGMPRADYEKLEILMNQAHKEGDRYILETPNSEAKDFCYPYFKLFDTTTTLVENQKYRIKRGLYIDIFPLDGLGNTLEEAKQNYKKVERKRNFLLIKTSGIRKGRSVGKNALILLARILPINEKKLLRKVAWSRNNKDFDKTLFGGNTLGAYRFKEIMPTSVMGIPELYNFESIQIYGAQEADKYLTSIYGDWRKLPPKEKQVTHHDFLYCDLNKSWLG